MHMTINKISTFTYFHLIQLLTSKTYVRQGIHKSEIFYFITSYLTVFILTGTEVECPDGQYAPPLTPLVNSTCIPI